jgi:hypothetical protein
MGQEQFTGPEPGSAHARTVKTKRSRRLPRRCAMGAVLSFSKIDRESEGVGFVERRQVEQNSLQNLQSCMKHSFFLRTVATSGSFILRALLLSHLWTHCAKL